MASNYKVAQIWASQTSPKTRKSNRTSARRGLFYSYDRVIGAIVFETGCDPESSTPLFALVEDPEYSYSPTTARHKGCMYSALAEFGIRAVYVSNVEDYIYPIESKGYEGLLKTFEEEIQTAEQEALEKLNKATHHARRKRLQREYRELTEQTSKDLAFLADPRRATLGIFIWDELGGPE